MAKYKNVQEILNAIEEKGISEFGENKVSKNVFNDVSDMATVLQEYPEVYNLLPGSMLYNEKIVDIMFNKVSQKPSLIKKIDVDTPNYRDIVAEALAVDGMALEYASDEIKNDIVFISDAIDNNEDAIQFASLKVAKGNPYLTKIKNEYDIRRAINLANNNKLSVEDYKSMSRVVFKSQNAMSAIIAKYPYAYKLMSKTLKKDDKAGVSLAVAVVKKDDSMYNVLPRVLKQNASVAEVRVAKDGLRLKRLSNILKSNKKVVKAAVVSNGFALRYATFDMKNNIDIVLAAVQANTIENERYFTEDQHKVLKYASAVVRNNKRVVMAAVKVDARAYQYADERMLNNKSVILTALESKNSNKMTKFIPDKKLEDSEIMVASLMANKKMVKRIPKSLKKNEEVIMAKMLYSKTSNKMAQIGNRIDKINVNIKKLSAKLEASKRYMSKHQNEQGSLKRELKYNKLKNKLDVAQANAEAKIKKLNAKFIVAEKKNTKKINKTYNFGQLRDPEFIKKVVRYNPRIIEHAAYKLQRDEGFMKDIIDLAMQDAMKENANRVKVNQMEYFKSNDINVLYEEASKENFNRKSALMVNKEEDILKDAKIVKGIKNKTALPSRNVSVERKGNTVSNELSTAQKNASEQKVSIINESNELEKANNSYNTENNINDNETIKA